MTELPITHVMRKYGSDTIKQYIVTIKIYQAGHNPRDKKVGMCFTSKFCTDKTGHHHSFLLRAVNPIHAKDETNKLFETPPHITRIEEVI